MHNQLLKKYKIKAKKSLGQNFLINDNIIKEISELININGNNIIEVGPGYGALTEEILNKSPKSLSLIEVDRDMISILNDRILNGDFNTLKTDINIHNIDILKYVPNYIDFNVIANIPYYITSPILRHFLYNLSNNPKYMIIMMQKDVGDKILKKKKNKSSVLSLIVDKKAFVSEKIFVGKENFSPVPKVDSSVLLFETHNLYSKISDNKFLEIIKIGFSSNRKKLIKNLQNGGYNKDKIKKIFGKLGFNENIRAEDLDIQKWIELILNL